MTGGFTKLFSSIVTSSLWQEDDSVRLIWITLLSLANRTGFVSGSLPGIAHIARVAQDETEQALDKLSSPDPHSRTTDYEGRRIEPVQGGWQILNYSHYRNKDATAAERQKRYREKTLSGEGLIVGNQQSQTVASQVGARINAVPPSSAQKPKREPAPKPTSSEVSDYCTSIGLPSSDGAAMFLHWEEKGWGKVKNWKLTIQKWKAFGYLPSQKQQKQTATKRPDVNLQRQDETVAKFLRERKATS
jgi:hypothetical protein